MLRMSQELPVIESLQRIIGVDSTMHNFISAVVFAIPLEFATNAGQSTSEGQKRHYILLEFGFMDCYARGVASIKNQESSNRENFHFFLEKLFPRATAEGKLSISRNRKILK